MENTGNVNNDEDITSQGSSDESLYYSVSSSSVLPPYEEFDNYSDVFQSDSSSIYSGIYQPVVGQANPTVYPAPANYIEVLGIFPVEVRGTTYYPPLFYYIPVHSNIYSPYSPYLGEQEYETDSTEYCSTHSDTEYLSSNSAEEYESYTELEEYDYEAGEFGYFNETNFETTSFEFSPSDDFELSKDEEYLAPESQKNNYEKEGCDNIEVQNEINYTSAENIKNNKADKHRPSYIGKMSERNNFSEKCSVNTFDFASLNSKYSQNHSSEKYNSFDDLSGKEQGQPLKKHQSFENLSLFEDNEIYGEDSQYENTEIMMDNYDENEKKYPDNDVPEVSHAISTSKEPPEKTFPDSGEETDAWEDSFFRSFDDEEFGIESCFNNTFENQFVQKSPNNNGYRNKYNSSSRSGKTFRIFGRLGKQIEILPTIDEEEEPVVESEKLHIMTEKPPLQINKEDIVVIEEGCLTSKQQNAEEMENRCGLDEATVKVDTSEKPKKKKRFKRIRRFFSELRSCFRKSESPPG